MAPSTDESGADDPDEDTSAAERIPSAPLRAIFVSIVTGTSCAGVMFVYNLPGALAHGLEQDYKVSASNVATLMTAYTIPSTVTALIAAELLALLGLNSISILCSIIVQVGSIVFALAPQLSPTSPFTMMVTAQLINGSGDPLGLACSPAMVARWWRHNHPGLAMGTTLMVTQLLGATMPFTLLPHVRSRMGLDAALWVGALAQAFSLISLFLYLWLEHCYAGYLSMVDDFDSNEAKRNDEGPSLSKQVLNRGGIVGFINRLKCIPYAARLQILAVCLIPVTQYVALGLLPVYLSKVHALSEGDAGNAASLVWWFCVTAPIFGTIADSPSVGRLHLQLVGSVIGSFCFMLLSADFHGWPVLVTMGISFAVLDQNSYVCVEALLPDPSLIDFTYGVMGGLFNLGMGLISCAAGSVPEEYLPYIFSASLGVGIMVTFCLILHVSPEFAQQKGLLPLSRVVVAPQVQPEPGHIYGKVAQDDDEVELSPLAS